MILFPAIDLKNGQCVRLEQGDMARATVFNLDPAAQAKSFAAQGFEYLHVVDLDGAFAGKPVNAHAVEAMLKVIAVPLQLGGGIRDLRTVEAWLEKGVARVIIGMSYETYGQIARYGFIAVIVVLQIPFVRSFLAVSTHKSLEIMCGWFGLSV